MADIILVQGSLSAGSKTSIIVGEAAAALTRRQVDHEILDLRRMELEFCDGRALKDYNQDLQGAYRKLEKARGYVFGMPVYCFSLSGALKNFIDITSGAMENKTAAIICNAGGDRSYMALGDLSKILAFESRVLTVQPAVYTSAGDFHEGRLVNDKIHARLDTMIDSLLNHLPRVP